MLREITPEGNALLAAIRYSESSLKPDAYRMRFGGKKGTQYFSDFSRHPRIFETVPWRSDGAKSSAAGAYQFTASTWDEMRKRYGFPDFSPQSQDTAAWMYAQQVYKSKTGRDLQPDLASGRVENAMRVLSSVWTSLPGGSETNKNRSHLQIYNETLAGKKS